MTKVQCSQSRAFENMKPVGLALVAHGCKLRRCITYSFGCSTRSVSSGLDLSKAVLLVTAAPTGQWMPIGEIPKSERSKSLTRKWEFEGCGFKSWCWQSIFSSQISYKVLQFVVRLFIWFECLWCRCIQNFNKIRESDNCQKGNINWSRQLAKKILATIFSRLQTTLWDSSYFVKY